MRNIRIPQRFRRPIRFAIWIIFILLVAYIAVSQGVGIALVNVTAGILANLVFDASKTSLPSQPTDQEIIGNHHVQSIIVEALLQIIEWIRRIPTHSRSLLFILTQLLEDRNHPSIRAIADEICRHGFRRIDDLAGRLLNPMLEPLLIEAAQKLPVNGDHHAALPMTREMLQRDFAKVVREGLKRDFAKGGEAAFVVISSQMSQLDEQQERATEEHRQQTFELLEEIKKRRKEQAKVLPIDREILSLLQELLERLPPKNP